MKKDRNSFFSEYNMNAYNTMPNQPMMPMNMVPNQVSSQSSFYSGPAYDTGMMQNPNQSNYTQDIESRISKIERQINRIETRLNKLESEYNNNTIVQSDTDIYKNNMYMV